MNDKKNLTWGLNSKLFTIITITITPCSGALNVTLRQIWTLSLYNCIERLNIHILRRSEVGFQCFSVQKVSANFEKVNPWSEFRICSGTHRHSFRENARIHPTEISNFGLFSPKLISISSSTDPDLHSEKDWILILYIEVSSQQEVQKYEGCRVSIRNPPCGGRINVDSVLLNMDNSNHHIYSLFYTAV